MHFCALTLNVGENRSSERFVFHLALETLFVLVRFFNYVEICIVSFFFKQVSYLRVLYEIVFGEVIFNLFEGSNNMFSYCTKFMCLYFYIRTHFHFPRIRILRFSRLITE